MIISCPAAIMGSTVALAFQPVEWDANCTDAVGAGTKNIACGRRSD